MPRPEPFALLDAGRCWNCAEPLADQFMRDMYDCEPCGLEISGQVMYLIGGRDPEEAIPDAG